MPTYESYVSVGKGVFAVAHCVLISTTTKKHWFDIARLSFGSTFACTGVSCNPHLIEGSSSFSCKSSVTRAILIHITAC
jgi:hypothetical protein